MDASHGALAIRAPAGKQTEGAPVNGAARAPSTGKGPLKAAAKKPKAFANNNRFLVPEDKLESFQATWADRAAEMKQFPGFQGFDISQQSDGTWLTVSRWETIPQWEAYSLSPEARRSHLPWVSQQMYGEAGGVYQFVPDKGAGFPEDFVPFKDLNRPVNAKY
eukprot:jgi/Astpho2/1589/Aster-x1017